MKNILPVDPLRSSSNSKPPRDGANTPNLPSLVQLPFHFGIDRMCRLVFISIILPFSVPIIPICVGLCGRGTVVRTSCNFYFFIHNSLGEF